MKDTFYSSAGGDLIRRFSCLLQKLLVLNFLTLVSCIPAITAGAALSAMYGCLIRIIRGQDVQAGKEFFRLFRGNLKQATLLWLPFFLIFLAAQVNAIILLAAPGVMPAWIVIPAASAAITAFLLFQFVMPVQSHFENPPLLTLRSAAILSITCFPKTMLMALLWAAPVVLFWKVTPSWPLAAMFGLSLPGYLCARVCNPIFLVLEEKRDEAA